MSRHHAKVLHIGLESPSQRMGGLNRYLDELSRAQMELNLDVARVWMSNEDSDVDVAVDPAAGWIARWRAFSRAIRRSNADIIDVHFAANVWWALLLGAFRRRPFVVHFQGSWAQESALSGDHKLIVQVKTKVEKFVLRRADRVVTLSHAFQSVAIERYSVAPHRVDVIAPGVTVAPLSERAAVRDRLGILNGDTVVVAVRRLVARMGLIEAVELFGQVRHDHEQLVIIGDGPLRGQLEQRIQDLNLTGAVRVLGRVSDEELAQWYRAADVSLVPTVAHEGFGLVVYESLSFGTPVIASDLDGLRDAARGCDAVRLISMVPSALREAIDEFSGGTQRVTARTFAESKSWANVAEAHRRMYLSVLNEPPCEGVVVLDHTARRSGGELAIVKMASALDADHWRMHLILAEHGELENELRQRSISYEVLEMDPHARSLSREELSNGGTLRIATSTLRYIVRLRRVIRRRQARVVHTNSMKAHVYGVLASICAPWAVVMHVRDRWAPPYLANNVANHLRSLAYWGPDRVITNSASTASTVGITSYVLPSPVEDEFFEVPAADPSSTVRIAVVGRLAPWKGQDLAIRAVAALRNDFDVKLTLVGDALFGEDGYASQLRELVAALDIEDVVNFAGHVDDVASQLGEVDVVVLTSRSPEPFGNVVIEAMAAARAVVVPNRGGVTEFVTEQGGRANGLFYEMNSLDSLISVLRRVVLDDELRRWLGRNAQQSAQAYRATSLAPLLELIYEDLA
jgi:glycosyltransferase involved in cell wall biosynthesis